jgi:hypothetical protein
MGGIWKMNAQVNRCTNFLSDDRQERKEMADNKNNL